MYDVVGISIKKNARIYYFSPNELDLSVKDMVVVETEKGKQLGQVVTEIQKKSENDLVLPLKNVLKIATKDDFDQYKQNEIEAKKALDDGKILVKQLGLNMRFIDAQFTLDKNQLLLNFVADERIDFRELAKRLAQIYKTRIELRQIGVRDKSKEVGGIGPCGRFLCCNTFLTDFNSVSINMAKNQFLSLNPTKINGVCGRLLCCLKYEDECYKECRKGMPKVGKKIKTEKGEGKVLSIDILKGTYRVDIPDVGIVEFEKAENESD